MPVCDLVAALYVALAVTAALRERDRSGQGQYIDVSLLESGVSLAVWEAGMWFGGGGGAARRAPPTSARAVPGVRTATGTSRSARTRRGCGSRSAPRSGWTSWPADPDYVDSEARMPTGSG